MSRPKKTIIVRISRTIQKMELRTDLYLGGCREELKRVPDNQVDLAVTSPPYDGQRRSTYGGVSMNEYADWFSLYPKNSFAFSSRRGLSY
jgi:DNA modification methylase